MLLGAYVLGGLAASDRDEFRRHLERCPDCRAELADSASLPGLLDLVPAEDAAALVGRQVHLAPVTLLRQVSKRRRRNGWLVAGGVAASLATGIMVSPALAPTPAADASYSVQAGHGLRMDLDLNSKTWGTELSFTGASLPKTGQLSLWVVDDRGTVDRAGHWMATPNGLSRITGAVPTPLAEIAAVQLRDTDGRVLADVSMDDKP